jgi:hypothetical protein
VAAVFGDNADVLEMKNKTLSADYFNTTSSVTHNSYPYSKVVVEKAAWKLYEEQLNPPRWKLVTINPGLVLGPSLSRTSESGSLSLLDQLLSGQPFLEVPDLWFGISEFSRSLYPGRQQNTRLCGASSHPQMDYPIFSNPEKQASECFDTHVRAIP